MNTCPSRAPRMPASATDTSARKRYTPVTGLWRVVAKRRATRGRRRAAPCWRVAPSSSVHAREVRGIAIELHADAALARLGRLFPAVAVAAHEVEDAARELHGVGVARRHVEGARVRVHEERRAERDERDRPGDRGEEAAAHARAALDVDHLERRGRRRPRGASSSTCGHRRAQHDVEHRQCSAALTIVIVSRTSASCVYGSLVGGRTPEKSVVQQTKAAAKRSSVVRRAGSA